MLIKDCSNFCQINFLLFQLCTVFGLFYVHKRTNIFKKGRNKLACDKYIPTAGHLLV